MTDETLETIAKYNNLCNYILLPVQSEVQDDEADERRYDRVWYWTGLQHQNGSSPVAASTTHVRIPF
jgi:hypothetical protein